MNAKQNLEQLDNEVREATREMEQTHARWMNTVVWAPEAAEVAAAKDAAARRYQDALNARAIAGGRSFPTWSELSGAPPAKKL